MALQERISPVSPGQPSGRSAKSPCTRYLKSYAGASSGLSSPGVRKLWARADWAGDKGCPPWTALPAPGLSDHRQLPAQAPGAHWSDCNVEGPWRLLGLPPRTMLDTRWGGQLWLVHVPPWESNRKITGISAFVNHPACEVAKQKHLGEKYGNIFWRWSYEGCCPKREKLALCPSNATDYLYSLG